MPACVMCTDVTPRVAATPGLEAMPTLGCFVPGYLLIVPRAHADEPVTVNVERDGTVVLLPRSMPTRLTPDEAETLAYRILAASGRSPE